MFFILFKTITNSNHNVNKKSFVIERFNLYGKAFNLSILFVKKQSRILINEKT